MIEGDERATALECWGLRLGMDYQNLLRTLILATHSYCDGDRDVWYIVVPVFCCMCVLTVFIIIFLRVTR